MALHLAEMQSFLQNRVAEDEDIQQQIQEAFKELSKCVTNLKALFLYINKSTG